MHLKLNHSLACEIYNVTATILGLVETTMRLFFEFLLRSYSMQAISGFIFAKMLCLLDCVYGDSFENENKFGHISCGSRLFWNSKSFATV